MYDTMSCINPRHKAKGPEWNGGIKGLVVVPQEWVLVWSQGRCTGLGMEDPGNKGMVILGIWGRGPGVRGLGFGE